MAAYVRAQVAHGGCCLVANFVWVHQETATFLTFLFVLLQTEC